jgi:glycosyltransferase involved in cell wall biosynthesis
MKILTICSIFPPYAKGGAELSAYNYARWLGNEGHEVSVLTSAKTKSDELHGVEVDGMKIWRLHWPRPYTVHDHDNQPLLSKAIWHLQDHLDPRNARMVSKVVEEVQPEFVNLHLVAGIGHNALSVFKHNKTVPVAYFLHDLGLACIRSTMYSKGCNCERQCTTCRVSSFLKFRQLKNLPAVYFVSPSASNLHSLESYTPIGDYRTSVIPNLDFESAILREQGPSDVPLKFIFVGRLHQTKGVDFLVGSIRPYCRGGKTVSSHYCGRRSHRDEIARQV